MDRVVDESTWYFDTTLALRKKIEAVSSVEMWSKYFSATCDPKGFRLDYNNKTGVLNVKCSEVQLIYTKERHDCIMCKRTTLYQMYCQKGGHAICEVCHKALLAKIDYTERISKENDVMEKCAFVETNVGLRYMLKQYNDIVKNEHLLYSDQLYFCQVCKMKNGEANFKIGPSPDFSSLYPIFEWMTRACYKLTPEMFQYILSDVMSQE